MPLPLPTPGSNQPLSLPTTDVVNDPRVKQELLEEHPKLRSVDRFDIKARENPTQNCFGYALGRNDAPAPRGVHDVQQLTTWLAQFGAWHMVMPSEVVQNGDIEFYQEAEYYVHVHVCLDPIWAKSKIGESYLIQHRRTALDGYGRISSRWRRGAAPVPAGAKPAGTAATPAKPGVGAAPGAKPAAGAAPAKPTAGAPAKGGAAAPTGSKGATTAPKVAPKVTPAPVKVAPKVAPTPAKVVPKATPAPVKAAPKVTPAPAKVAPKAAPPKGKK